MPLMKTETADKLSRITAELFDADIIVNKIIWLGGNAANLKWWKQRHAAAKKKSFAHSRIALEPA